MLDISSRDRPRVLEDSVTCCGEREAWIWLSDRSGTAQVCCSRKSPCGHEQVVFIQDPKTGLRGIIAIHSTVLGPALGGTRMYPYASEGDALRDVLELSRGMTYKAAAAGLNLGGGKAVIIGDSRTHKSEALLRAFGRFVNRPNGLFYTGEDVGTDVRDLETVAKETAYVGGLAREHGGGGDPSPVTAYGVFQGMKACAAERWGSTSVRGQRVAVQGLGTLASRLQKAGASVIGCDVDPARAKAARERLQIATIDPDDIYGVAADIFAPCALGGAISERTLPRLGVEIIAGSANNQILSATVAEEVFRRGILYAPDYVINAGGLVNVTWKWKVTIRSAPCGSRGRSTVGYETCSHFHGNSTCRPVPPPTESQKSG